MKKNRTYQPDEIESILLLKKFEELEQEEREFVLHHVESPEEYESLRHTLREILRHDAPGQMADPPSSIKSNLMAEFVTEKKGGFAVWLNSIFAFPEVPFQRRGMYAGLALAGIGVIAVVLFMLPGREKQLAQQVPTADRKQELKVKEPLPAGETAEVERKESIPTEMLAPAQAEYRNAEVPYDEMDSPGAFADNSSESIEEAKSISADDVSVLDFYSTEATKTLTLEKNEVSPSAPATMKDNLNLDVATGNSQSTSNIKELEATMKKARERTVTDKTAAPTSRSAADKKDLLDLLFTAL